jgi:cobalt-zinc-cadmium efflux system membrane fusion protein
MMQAVATRWGKLLLGGLLGILALGAVSVGVLLLDQHKKAHAEAGVAKAAVTASPAARPTRVGPDSLILPPEVVRSLDVRTAAVAGQCRPRSLPPFAGTLALENDRLARARTRFAGEVIALGTPNGNETTQLSNVGSASDRPLAVGDRVTRGQLLAVVWSKDLGEKKSELVDAVSKLKLHREVRDKLRKLLSEGATNERGVREAEQQVESDLIAVAKAEQTLRAWQLTDAQLDAIRAVADKVVHSADGRVNDPAWARVEVRAPLDGVILEKNVNFGDVVDTSADLYRIADLTRLAVWAHVYEEDLPLLQNQNLPRPLPWVVRVPGRKDATYPGHLERIGDLIDPNQHTALVVGHVENVGGTLRVGQYVTVTVDLPPAADEIEIPATAVVEDGRESIVFVQPDAGRLQFVRRTVSVVRRFHDVVYVKVRSASDGSVNPGERVVIGGAVFLKDALAELPQEKPGEKN